MLSISSASIVLIATCIFRRTECGPLDWAAQIARNDRSKKIKEKKNHCNISFEHLTDCIHLSISIFTVPIDVNLPWLPCK